MPTEFVRRARALEPELIAWRRELHRHPELGFDLPRTTAFVQEKLASFGLKPRRVGKAGIVATVGGGGRTILLRADMDALPILEQTGLDFASREDGRMHACGHDFHTAALLGAARLLAERAREEPASGTVLLVFQPNEEGLTGAQDMLDAGLFDAGTPDAALAQHVALRRTGTAGISAGAASSSCDVFQITLRGTGTHGASPHLGVDPINAAAHLITALQALNSRETAPGAMLVLTVCQVHGGSTHNVLPEHCALSGTIRTMDPQIRSFARQRLAEIAAGVAGTFRARAEVEWLGGIPSAHNDERLREAFGRTIDEMFGEGTAWDIPPMTGSEDFSLFAERLPSVLVLFGAGDAGEGYRYNIHHPKATFHEEALHRMCAVYAGCAWKWLEDHR